MTVPPLNTINHVIAQRASCCHGKVRSWLPSEIKTAKWCPYSRANDQNAIAESEIFGHQARRLGIRCLRRTRHWVSFQKPTPSLASPSLAPGEWRPVADRCLNPQRHHSSCGPHTWYPDASRELAKTCAIPIGSGSHLQVDILPLVGALRIVPSALALGELSCEERLAMLTGTL